jgi:hypothetical protein
MLSHRTAHNPKSGARRTTSRRPMPQQEVAHVWSSLAR